MEAVTERTMKKRTILRKPLWTGITIWEEPDNITDWFDHYLYWDELAYYLDLR